MGPAIASPRRHAGRRAAAPWLLGFILAVIAGAVVNALPPLAALTLGAPLYLLAAVLPAIGVVAYALAETKTARQGVAARAAYGGCVATTIAMLMELVLLVFVVVIVYLVLGATPEGREAIDAVSSALQAQSAPGAPETVDLTVFTDLLRQPAVLLAAFAVLGFLGPLIEESAKVGIVALRVPPLRSRAWVWGVAAGAGFGTIEAMALGTLALQAWPMSMAMRGGATLMHATTTGLAALAVYALLAERKPARALVGFALAVAAHAAWNSLVLLAAAAGAHEAVADSGTAAGVISVTSVLLLGVLFVVIATAFSQVSRKVAMAPEQHQLDVT